MFLAPIGQHYNEFPAPTGQHNNEFLTRTEQLPTTSFQLQLENSPQNL
jgi:hypothetical protein